MPYLHSIYLTDDDPVDERPWAIERNIESLVHHHPGFEHRLWDSESGRQFILTHFGQDVVYAWDELVPLSYRADLLRFCLLYKLGGVYADVSVHFFAPLVKVADHPRILFFRDLFNQAPWIVGTGLIYAPSGKEVFANCIERIVEHVRTGYYGDNALSPTGPNLLGREVAQWGGLDEISLGEAAAILKTNGGTSAGLSYIDANGRLVAVIAKANSGLAALGATNQNDYNTFYKRRKIYRRQLAEPDIWTAEEYRQRSMWNVEEADDYGSAYFKAGCALYGPYVPLDASRYRARFLFKGNPPSGATIDVRSGEVNLVDGRPALEADGALKIEFELTQAYESVEIRLFLDHEQRTTFDRLEISTI